MKILLIPYQQNESIILPKNLVKYVLPYAPVLPSTLKHPLVIGSLIYENEKIPIVNFSTQFTAIDNRNSQAKLIIVACIADESPVNYYAVVANHSPRMLDIAEKDLEETNESVPALFHSLVKITEGQNEQLVFVPNMEQIETEIFTQ